MILLIAQSMMVLALGLWLSLGLYDNLRHSHVNGDFVREVLTLARLKDEFPELYAVYAARAVHDERALRWLFRLILGAEAVAVVLLWAGFLSLFLALVGALAPGTAQEIATLGALAFTLVWSGFLIGGNYWCYWMCHEGAQNTHFQMTLWGLGVMILLSV